MHGYSEQKPKILNRLKRIEGQVRGLQRMVDEDKYCIEILDQVNAVSKALRAVSVELLDDHLKHCVSSAVHDHDVDADVKLAEASAAVARLLRS